MACNENIIKNIANEVTRNCCFQNINVEPEFVAYLIELLLLNPKYGKLFAKTLNRKALAYFVDECFAKIARGGTPLNTLKMQFIMRSNYDKLKILVQQHLEQVDSCLSPLLQEIVDADPELENVAEVRKVYRKLSIYILLYSGLGNPAIVMNLKEGISAMESVFSLEDLKEMLLMPRVDRQARIDEVIKLTSGVRLLNRDCKKGGEAIPDLPFDLVDAGAACLASLSNSLISVMQRVNMLTTGVEDRMSVHEESGKVILNVMENLSRQNYENIFELLIFNRQYEIYIRRMLVDTQGIVDASKELAEKYKNALGELHSAIKYKAAVPCDIVFPLFIKLWDIWRDMQNTMFLVSTINRLMAILSGIQEHNKIPYSIIEKMLEGKIVTDDEERMNISVPKPMSLLALLTPFDHAFDKDHGHEQGMSGLPKGCEYSITNLEDTRLIAFLGFCVVSLNVGALVPSNLKIGFIKYNGCRYGFANPTMALAFARDPDRYIKEVIQYARDHPQIINLLRMDKFVRDAKDIEQLVTEFMPQKMLAEKDVQTSLHPREKYIEYGYSWNLWEWKRRACKFASVANSRTHATQTVYSHMRSNIHSQTVEPRDKNLQTMKEAATNTNTCKYFVWGLRGQLGDGQHAMDMVLKQDPEKAKPHTVEPCSCENMGNVPSGDSSESDSFVDTKSVISFGSFRHKSKLFYSGDDNVD